MSRYLNRRRRFTLRDFQNSRTAWDTYEARVEEAELARLEREQDELAVRRAARNTWTPRSAA